MDTNLLHHSLRCIDQLFNKLPNLKRKDSGSYCDAVCNCLLNYGVDVVEFKSLFEKHRNISPYSNEVLDNQALILDATTNLKSRIKSRIAAKGVTTDQGIRTADSPLFISRQTLTNPSFLNSAGSMEDKFRIEGHLTTLKLRLKARIDDRRWKAFLNYEDDNINIKDFACWLTRFGFGGKTGPKVSILDLSMLSNEALPYACSVVGRILLEVREMLPADRRFKHPWVLVLEEAHNYVCPASPDEDRGHKLARLSYERIVKEGRKFGISLIIASQRPSEISPTIISQCANFISHRLQNPEDIDFLRRIIPVQARRLLDQVAILESGEAIVFGSTFNVPSRVQFDCPEPGPYSQTAAPFLEWSNETDPFPLLEVTNAWGVKPPDTNSASMNRTDI